MYATSLSFERLTRAFPVTVADAAPTIGSACLAAPPLRFTAAPARSARPAFRASGTDCTMTAKVLLGFARASCSNAGSTVLCAGLDFATASVGTDASTRTTTAIAVHQRTTHPG